MLDRVLGNEGINGVAYYPASPDEEALDWKCEDHVLIKMISSTISMFYLRVNECRRTRSGTSLE